jgi:hypothetical protein
MSQQPNRYPISQWNNNSINAWANGTNNNNSNNRPTIWKDHGKTEENGSYIMSSESDWVMSTARRCSIHYGCSTCYGLNFQRRTGIKDNGDGTFTSHFHFCSSACKNFNKKQNYFAYQFFRSGNGGAGDGIYGPRQTEQRNVESVNSINYSNFQFLFLL